MIQKQYGGFKKALQRAYPEVSFERWHRKSLAIPPSLRCYPKHGNPPPETKLRSENPQTGNEVDNQLHT